MAQTLSEKDSVGLSTVLCANPPAPFRVTVDLPPSAVRSLGDGIEKCLPK